MNFNECVICKIEFEMREFVWFTPVARLQRWERGMFYNIEFFNVGTGETRIHKNVFKKFAGRIMRNATEQYGDNFYLNPKSIATYMDLLLCSDDNMLTPEPGYETRPVNIADLMPNI